MSAPTYPEVYRSLSGMIALAVAGAMPLRQQKNERDTAFVKRIVAAYVTIASGGSIDIDDETEATVASAYCGDEK